MSLALHQQLTTKPEAKSISETSSPKKEVAPKEKFQKKILKMMICN
jgi:hypothetical protein